jgi:hypothetical protein
LDGGGGRDYVYGGAGLDFLDGGADEEEDLLNGGTEPECDAENFDCEDVCIYHYPLVMERFVDCEDLLEL